MENRRVLYLFSILLLSGTQIIRGQSTNNVVKYIPVFRNPDFVTTKGLYTKELNIDKWVDQTSKDIVNVRPGAFTAHPIEDKIVIRSAYNSIRSRMQELGFSDTQILKSLFNSWVELSIKGFDKNSSETQYTKLDLINVALHSGMLIVKTEPEGAIIRVDDYECCGRTDAELWLSEGQHRIVIIKDGYLTVSEIVKIIPKAKNDLIRKLQIKAN